MQLEETRQKLQDGYQLQEHLTKQLEVAEEYSKRKSPLVPVKTDSNTSGIGGSPTRGELEGFEATLMNSAPELKAVIDNLKGFQVKASDLLVAESEGAMLQLGVYTVADTLKKSWQAIQNKYNAYEFDPDSPPSQSAKREELIAAQMVCRKQFIATWNKYRTKLKSESVNRELQIRLDHIDKTLQEHQQEEKKFQSCRKEIDACRFESEHRPDESLLNPGKSRPGQIVKMALTTLHKLQDGSAEDAMKAELNVYTAGSIAQSVCNSLCTNFEIELARQDTPDNKMRHLHLYKSALGRLRPEMLPLDLQDNIPHPGQVYLARILEEAEARMDRMVDVRPDLYPAPLADDVRGVTGQKIVSTLLENPGFCQDVLAFLSSTKTSHADIPNQWIDYPLASETWLRDMRIKYQLVDVPTFTELLEGCMQDVQHRNGSRLLASYIASHEGRYETGDHTPRREKLIKRIESCQMQERSLEGTAAYWRGQANDGDKLVEHPHRQVLDCFKKDTPGQLVDVVKTQDVGMSHKTTPLSVNKNALLNTFIRRCWKAGYQ